MHNAVTINRQVLVGIIAFANFSACGREVTGKRTGSAPATTSQDATVDPAAASARANEFPPEAHPQFIKAVEGQPVALILTATDPDGDSLEFAITTPAAKGDISLEGSVSGKAVYLAQPGQAGSDAFTFSASDGKFSSTATVALEILPLNDPPIVADVSFSSLNTADVFYLTATDPDSSVLTFTLVTLPEKGAAELDSTTGTLTYQPRTGQTGTDTFFYKASDGAIDSNVARIDILLPPVAPLSGPADPTTPLDPPTGPNTPPVAQSFVVNGTEDQSLPIELAGSDQDNDALSYTVTALPARGTIDPGASASRQFTYTPTRDASGTDFFQYKVNDGKADSAVATVSVVIAPVNDRPIAKPGALTVEAGRPGSGTLVAEDVDSVQFTYSIETQGTKGTAVLTDVATGRFTYTAASDSLGSDSFTFRARDASLNSAPATVAITILPAAQSCSIAATPARIQRGQNVLIDFAPSGSITTGSLKSSTPGVFEPYAAGDTLSGIPSRWKMVLAPDRTTRFDGSVIGAGGGTSACTLNLPVDPPVPVVSLATVANGLWKLKDVLNASTVWEFSFGAAGDTPLVGDYDGDGRQDLILFRGGTWIIDRQNDEAVGEVAFAFGLATDIPVVGDYDGDGNADLGVFRNGTWFFDRDRDYTTVELQFSLGTTGDQPVVGDLNGDGKADFGVYRQGAWTTRLSQVPGATDVNETFGAGGGQALLADFNGDGLADKAVFKDGVWSTTARNAAGDRLQYTWGQGGDAAVVAVNLANRCRYVEAPHYFFGHSSVSSSMRADGFSKNGRVYAMIPSVADLGYGTHAVTINENARFVFDGLKMANYLAFEDRSPDWTLAKGTFDTASGVFNATTVWGFSGEMTAAIRDSMPPYLVAATRHGWGPIASIVELERGRSLCYDNNPRNWIRYRVTVDAASVCKWPEKFSYYSAAWIPCAAMTTVSGTDVVFACNTQGTDPNSWPRLPAVGSITSVPIASFVGFYHAQRQVLMKQTSD